MSFFFSSAKLLLFFSMAYYIGVFLCFSAYFIDLFPYSSHLCMLICQWHYFDDREYAFVDFKAYVFVGEGHAVDLVRSVLVLGAWVESQYAYERLEVFGGEMVL